MAFTSSLRHMPLVSHRLLGLVAEVPGGAPTLLVEEPREHGLDEAVEDELGATAKR